MSSLKTTHRWAVAQQNPELEKELSAGLGIPGLVARIMVAHGITSIEEGQLFLTPSLDRDWADPRVIPGMAVVVDRDMENGTVSPRHRADGDLGAMSMDEFSALLKQVVDNKEKK